MECYKDFKTPYSLWTCHPQTWASWYAAVTYVLQLVYTLHLREGIHILYEVFSTGEAWFHFSGNITRKNNRIWSAENLQTFCKIVTLVKNPNMVCCFFVENRQCHFLETDANSGMLPRIVNFIALLQVHE